MLYPESTWSISPVMPPLISDKRNKAELATSSNVIFLLRRLLEWVQQIKDEKFFIPTIVRYCGHVYGQHEPCVSVQTLRRWSVCAKVAGR